MFVGKKVARRRSSPPAHSVVTAMASGAQGYAAADGAPAPVARTSEPCHSAVYRSAGIMATEPRTTLSCFPFLSQDGEAKFADLRVMSAARWLLESRRQDARGILRRVGGGRLDYPVVPVAAGAWAEGSEPGDRLSFGDRFVPEPVRRLRTSAFLAMHDGLADASFQIRGMLTGTAEHFMVRTITLLREGRLRMFAESLGAVRPVLQVGTSLHVPRIALPAEPCAFTAGPLFRALGRHAAASPDDLPLWYGLELYTAAFGELGQATAFARFIHLYSAIQYLKGPDEDAYPVNPEAGNTQV